MGKPTTRDCGGNPGVAACEERIAERAKRVERMAVQIGRTTAPVLAQVHMERARQEVLREDGKFPATCADPSRPDTAKLPVLIEEVGEAARALCEAGGATDVQSAGLRAELVQVAAVAVAWIEAIDAREGRHG
jgi:hypothetical protein